MMEEDGEVEGAGRLTPRDLQEALAQTIGAVRETPPPPATRQEFQGRFGRPTKPGDPRRGKRRRE